MRVPVVLKIAVRNVREHKSKSAIVGVLITLGVAALVVGNSIMDTAAAGIRDAYIRSFTGDLVVSGIGEGNLSLFGGTGPQGQGATPRVDQYRRVRDYLEGHDLVASVSPQVHGSAVVSVDQEQAGFSFVFGIQPQAYQETFPSNLTVLEGRFLEAGESGIVLNAGTREDLEEESGRELAVGDELLLTGLSQTAGTRIRSVQIVGVFEFDAANPSLDNISFADAQTMRALNAMNVSPVEAVELTETERRLLRDFDEEELFGGGEDSMFGDAVTSDEEAPGPDGGGPEAGSEAGEDVASREEELSNIFADLPDRPAEADDASAWHFLVLRSADPGQTARLQGDIQRFLRQEGIEAQVMDWEQAAGPSSSFVAGIQIALNAAIILVAIVALIIIMNTLVISVTERIPEIGTMRAIGAHRGFVRRMILSETAVLSLVFGVLGALIGMGILGILSAVGLEATNQFLRFIYGGEVLRPLISADAVGTALLGVLIAGLLASLYPTRVALKIRPVVAMQGK